MIRTTSACRSSSVPVRKSPKDVSSNVSKEGIIKYLTQKRQASSSPVKDDTQFKVKVGQSWGFTSRSTARVILGHVLRIATCGTRTHRGDSL